MGGGAGPLPLEYTWPRQELLSGVVSLCSRMCLPTSDRFPSLKHFIYSVDSLYFL